MRWIYSEFVVACQSRSRSTVCVCAPSNYPRPIQEPPRPISTQFTRSSIAAGAATEAAWTANLDAYCAKYPEEGKEVKQLLSNKLPEGWEKALPTFTPEDKGLATRVHSNTMINALAEALPGMQLLGVVGSEWLELFLLRRVDWVTRFCFEWSSFDG